MSFLLNHGLMDDSSNNIWWVISESNGFWWDFEDMPTNSMFYLLLGILIESCIIIICRIQIIQASSPKRRVFFVTNLEFQKYCHTNKTHFHHASLLNVLKKLRFRDVVAFFGGSKFRGNRFGPGNILNMPCSYHPKTNSSPRLKIDP